VSSQGKKGDAAADIMVTVAHAPGAALKCEKNDAPGGCSAPEHWWVQVKFGMTDELGKVFALDDTEPLKEYLVLAASPKAKTKHADRVNVSDATMSVRVPAAMPYSFVQSLLMITGSAGIHRLEFAVVPAADGGEQLLPVPLPLDEAPVLVDDPKAAPPEVRIALIADAKTGACTRRFGRTMLADGAVGDAQLLTNLKDVHADRVRIGRPETPCIIDAAAGVPWQAVVGVIDACHAAGVPVQFAAASSKK
jgi:biopolymer transport protein ExbD